MNYECSVLANIIFDKYENNDKLIELDSSVILEELKTEDNIDSFIIKEIVDKNIDFLPEDKVKLIENLVETIKYSKLKIERKKIIDKIQKIESKIDKNEGDVDKFKLLCLKLTELDKELKSRI